MLASITGRLKGLQASLLFEARFSLKVHEKLVLRKKRVPIVPEFSLDLLTGMILLKDFTFL